MCVYVYVFMYIRMCVCMYVYRGVRSCLKAVRPLQQNKSMKLLESYLCFKDFHINSDARAKYL